MLLTRPTQKGVIVTREVCGKVPSEGRGLGGQYRNKEQALLARISTTAYGRCLEGGKGKRSGERAHALQFGVRISTGVGVCGEVS